MSDKHSTRSRSLIISYFTTLIGVTPRISSGVILSLSDGLIPPGIYFKITCDSRTILQEDREIEEHISVPKSTMIVLGGLQDLFSQAVSSSVGSVFS